MFCRLNANYFLPKSPLKVRLRVLDIQAIFSAYILKRFALNHTWFGHVRLSDVPAEHAPTAEMWAFVGNAELVSLQRNFG